MHYIALVLLVACAPSDPSTPSPAEQDAGGIPGDPTTADQLYKSGTRIQARTLKTADGAEFFQSWYDAELGEACFFGVAADGATRCLPTKALTAGSYYQPGCTALLASGPACSAKYVRVGVAPSDGCGEYRTKVYEVGGSYSGDVYIGTPGNCLKITAPASLVTLGGEVPPAEFVPTL